MITASVQTSADGGPFLPYLAGAVLLLLYMAAFVFVWWLACRSKQYVARKRREAEEAIADPVLAAHRGHSTRLVRALDNGDRQILHALTEQEHVRRERVTVPRRPH